MLLFDATGPLRDRRDVAPTSGSIMRIAVTGGGPSGLVTLKYLCEAQKSLGCEPVEVVLFEYQDGVGGTFLGRAYEDAEVSCAEESEAMVLTETACLIKATDLLFRLPSSELKGFSCRV